MFRGIGVSPGIVIGKAFVVERGRLKVDKRPIPEDQVEKEIARLHKAIRDAHKQLDQVKENFSKEITDKTFLYIIDIQLQVLNDQMLIGETENVIRREQVNAEWALEQVITKLAAFFDTIEDSYLRERRADVEHIGERIKRNLIGKEMISLSDIKEDVVVVAHDLTPADTVHMHQGRVKGFATDMGGRTSHTTIIARSLEIPAVVALGNISTQVKTGDHIIVDGREGVVILNPTQEQFKTYLEKKQKFIYFEREMLKLRNLPAETLDGYRIELSANIEFPEEVPTILEHGAEGVGLYRTEFLYLNRPVLPTEEDQYKAYYTLAKQLAPLPATIRTMDFGGDKVDHHIKAAPETNPALGLRAIRFALKREDMLRQQLRAILRASVLKNLRIMFPLISGVNELVKAKEVLESVKDELRLQDIPFDENIPVGVMIEVPSAAMTADLLAKECDFFSIGTNDLIQYYIAIDRGNEQVAYLYEPLHPAVLRTIKSVIAAAHNEGIWVGMCGEMAGDVMSSLILLGMEIDELSMNAISIPTIKRIIRSVRLEEAAAITYKALTLPTAKQIEEYISQEMTRRFPELF